MYKILNLEDTTDVKLSGVINHDRNPHRPTFHIPHYGLKVKGRKNRKAKSPSSCQQNQMLHAIKHHQNTSLRNSTRMIPPFLPFDEPNLYNDYIFMDPEYNERCFLNQADSNTNLLDNVI